MCMTNWRRLEYLTFASQDNRRKEYFRIAISLHSCVRGWVESGFTWFDYFTTWKGVEITILFIKQFVGGICSHQWNVISFEFHSKLNPNCNHIEFYCELCSVKCFENVPKMCAKNSVNRNNTIRKQKKVQFLDVIWLRSAQWVKKNSVKTAA